ncbi:hypothetical protein WOLCODRAFT_152495 [Wolfiporia cocos MD-104 SS10]|uniref:Uncharacterized protein n=1 Tax=Wolfiporia cocos (strain MD-104) TaxID=742152 RepID=A0A2H3JRE4_WOLCO|nr:hypothetical protein WOLCODRAFT_152495 [Wolfiporia cocos MD-104 SS10]
MDAKKGGGHPPLCKIYSIDEVTPEQITYTALITCFGYVSQNIWDDNDSTFLGAEFYTYILNVFKADADWAAQMLAWFNNLDDNEDKEAVAAQVNSEEQVEVQVDSEEQVEEQVDGEQAEGVDELMEEDGEEEAGDDKAEDEDEDEDGEEDSKEDGKVSQIQCYGSNIRFSVNN